jgi:hypothetical protein
MNDLSSEAQESLDNEAVAPPEDDAWTEYKREAVRDFLKNVVVIDNEPRVTPDEPVAEEIIDPPEAPSDATDHEGESKFNKVARPETGDDDRTESHPLDIRVVSDAFAEEGIACAFVLPDDGDETDGAVERIKERVLKAARFTDLVVIDWHLRGNNPRLTLEILTETAKADVAERERMRLICIYTGQDIDSGKGILDGATKALAEGGISVVPVDGAPNTAKSANCLLFIASKNDLPPERLPTALVNKFTHLADGLLPSFALAAVGAVRKNVHHMLTRFSSTLDSAYVANRMITDPPGDVAELIRELFVTECDNALGLERVADRFLEVDSILKWMDARKAPLQVGKNYEIKKNTNGKTQKSTVTLDREFLNALVNYGVNDGNMYLNEKGEKQEFKEWDRKLVSKALAPDDSSATKSEREFARLVTLRREAYGSTKMVDGKNWRPSLTTGTILKVSGNTHFGSSYFICLTPACDTLRLDGDKRFVFMGNVTDGKKTNLVVTDEGGAIQELYFPHDRPNLATFTFVPDKVTRRVQAARKGEGLDAKYVFSNTGNVAEFLWLGEVRYGRATSDAANVARNWMRIGINDSEFLRLSAKGVAGF